MLRSLVYSSSSSDLIYTELEVTNNENHQIDLSQFTGAYQSSNGQSYKASASQIETSAAPDQKSIVSLWARIPKSISTSDIKLIVGEGITDNKLTPIKGEPNGYVNAAALELGGTTSPTLSTTLENMDMLPYKLTVKNAKASLTGSSSVQLSFDYTQTRNMDYAIGEYGHKYLFEVIDSSGHTFEKEFTPETDLRVTSGGSASFSINDIIYENKRSGTFQLNVYDLFDGHKVKLGSKSFYYTTASLEKHTTSPNPPDLGLFLSTKTSIIDCNRVIEEEHDEDGLENSNGRGIGWRQCLGRFAAEYASGRCGNDARYCG